MLSFLKDKPKPARQRLMRHTSVVLDGRRVGVQITENARANRLTLRLLPAPKDGDRLKITVPAGTPLDEIDDFLDRHKAWAATRLSRLPDVQEIDHGAVISFRGISHRVVHSGKMRGVVEQDEQDGEPVLLVHGDEKFIARRVADFLKKHARADLEQAVAHYAKLLKVKPKSITIRDTTSRWGSCSSNGALNFSWRIILAPPEVLNYLAAHEVAHLREMNHSDRFWALVEKVCPDMKVQRAWLKANGAELHAVMA